jgi:ATP-dependent helicase/nuclease subunit A
MPLGPGDTAEPGAEDTPEQREAWKTRRAATIARLGTAPVTAATAIARAATEDEESERDDATDTEPWKKGRAGTSVGRAVHAVLQTIDLATGDGLEPTARAQAVAEGIADEGAHIAQLVESARSSAVVQEAVRSGRYWREVYVGAALEGMLVEGFIDLLYESADGLVVIDYKTDSARDLAAIERSMEKYRLQGAAYALALEQAVGRPVTRVVFVFAEPRHEYTLDGLEEAKRAVLGILREQAIPAAG